MKSVLIVVVVILVVNALAADWVLYKLWQRPAGGENKTVVQNNYIYPTPEPTVTEAATPSTVPVKTVGQVKRTRSTLIVPIPGSGSTGENKWINLPGTEFFLNSDDYPTMKEAYLEVNMRLINGNGKAFVRLFDITSGIEVWGSEVETNSQNYTVVTSGKITLRPGNKQYRIQAKSLTADTAVYNSGRIKIVVEN